MSRAILSRCGHTLCQGFPQKSLTIACPIEGCNADVMPHKKLDDGRLGKSHGLTSNPTSALEFDTKVAHLMTALKLIRKRSDKALLFIQEEAAYAVLKEEMTLNRIPFATL